jgi:hypothetical protein
MPIRRSVLLGTIPPAIAPNNNALSHQMTAESSPHHGLAVPRWPAVLMLAFLVSTTAHAQAPAGPNRPVGVPDGYVITPSGYFHPSCVRRLAEGDTLLENGPAIQHADGTVEKLPVCEYPHYTPSGEMAIQGLGVSGNPTAWVEDAETTSNPPIGTSYGELTATWTVPPDPTPHSSNCQIPKSCQTVLFFPGLQQAIQNTTILQPVLGWNQDFAAAWSIASWNCCPVGNNLESKPVLVNQNDKITGIIKNTCSAGTLTCPVWYVTTRDVNLGKSTTQAITGNTETFNWAFAGVLEVYNLIQCSDYPPNSQLTFSGVALYDYNFNKISHPKWKFMNDTPLWPTPPPQCGYFVLPAQTHVTLDYLPTVLLKPYGTVQVSTTPPPYSTVVVDGNLCSATAPADPICTQGLATDVTVTLDRQVISQCGPCLYPGKSPPCTIFQRNDTVVISQGQTTGTFSDVAGRNPSCNTLPITTQWTITGAVLAPTNLSLNLSLVPLEQLMLSAVN